MLSRVPNTVKIYQISKYIELYTQVDIVICTYIIKLSPVIFKLKKKKKQCWLRILR